ncbi:ABC transporter permease [Falsochrobactrum ovis]|uniref:Monosaccharide ABC transporter membrane protein (CUT2 family) n=1 Tax=Falsochrobactrum ovis TaxID=1293442 RepID=A0A364JTT1_9HYPH|nr:ABC transporter permease [Falsochrobactrum ovis]RAK27361.1 monosaccharide ABC transporter membrane protein (CUT2 family) [Falsochrobactrum ovis]
MPSISLDRQTLFLLLINIAVLAAGATFAGAHFMDSYNLQSMAAQVPELGLLALGVALAMISGNGGIDLSGIALANLAGIVAFLLARQIIPVDEAPLLFSWVFAGLALCVGLVGGLINGVMIAYARLTPLIATLGTQLVFTGFAVFLTNGSAITLGYIEPLDNFGNMPILSIPMCFALFLAIAALLGFVLKYTPFGVKLMLLGSNSKAARYGGINETRMLLITYTICGVLASIAGIIIAARNSSVKWDYGGSYVLIAILIAVLGGVKPEGGYGKVLCVLLAATALQILSSLFNFMDISNFFRDLAWGVLLLVLLASARVDLGYWLRLRR